MDFKDNIVYAIRTIKIYEYLESEPNYQYTIITGTLLNIFSAIIPDGTLLLHSSLLINYNFPKFELNSFDNLNKYFTNLRNSLAHKTKGNFEIHSGEINRDISFITFDSRNGTKIVLNLKELKIILNNIKLVMYEQFKEDFQNEFSLKIKG